jgi:ParB family chromosome partitioning protein
MSKNRALGKGLHSLLPPRPQPAAPVAEAPAPPSPAAELPVTELPVDAIKTNPNQPRKDFRDQQLLELALSISAEGIIQPLVVRKNGSNYELIAGERRLRAARLAGLTKVPVILHNIADDRILEVALIENIQREDLNPIELAIAFQRMSTELGLNHEEIGTRTGKDRTTITNSIRLLQLPDDVQQLVAARKLSPGHARALLKLPTPDLQRATALTAIEQGWSVRQMEQNTSPDRKTEPPGPSRTPAEPKPVDPNVRAAVEELQRVLGTKVHIHDNGRGRGSIEIEFYTPDDLDRLYSLIAKTETD